MKSKVLLISFIVVFAACNQAETHTQKANESTPKAEAAEGIDMNGPLFEANVLSFSAESHKTQIELINRSDEPVNNISMRMVFLDENGNEITTATGRRKDSPFQFTSNPHVIAAKSKTTITVRNKIEAGTSSIRLEEIKAIGTSDDALEF